MVVVWRRGRKRRGKEDEMEKEGEEKVKEGRK